VRRECSSPRHGLLHRAAAPLCGRAADVAWRRHRDRSSGSRPPTCEEEPCPPSPCPPPPWHCCSPPPPRHSPSRRPHRPSRPWSASGRRSRSTPASAGIEPVETDPVENEEVETGAGESGAVDGGEVEGGEVEGEVATLDVAVDLEGGEATDPAALPDDPATIESTGPTLAATECATCDPADPASPLGAAVTDGYQDDGHDRPFWWERDGLHFRDPIPANGYVNINVPGASNLNVDVHRDLIGATFVPWSAFGLEPGMCIAWTESNGYDYHFGEDNSGRGGVDERGWEYCVPEDPSDPTDPSEPTEPTDPSEPTEPGDPTEPGEPGQSTGPEVLTASAAGSTPSAAPTATPTPARTTPPALAVTGAGAAASAAVAGLAAVAGAALKSVSGLRRHR